MTFVYRLTLAKANKAISLGMVSMIAIILVAAFFLVPTSHTIIVPSSSNTIANVDVVYHTSLSCQVLGVGEMNFQGVAASSGNQWSANCSKSDILEPSASLNITITTIQNPESATMSTYTTSTCFANLNATTTGNCVTPPPIPLASTKN